MKQFLSFLGKSDYVFCTYFLRDPEKKVENVKYVQTATLELIQNEGVKFDRFTFFLTDEAKSKNWEGLKNEFKKHMIDLNLLEEVSIPSGKEEKEVWELFDIIYKNIRENGEIYVDITHSFRHLPMFLTVVLNYAKFLKNIEVKFIGYGALEAKNEKGLVPIFDLTPINEIQEWTIATERFVKSGDAEEIYSKAEKIRTNFFKKGKLDLEYSNAIRHFSTYLKGLTEDILTNRGLTIISGTKKKKISENIEKFKNNDTNLVYKLKPLKNLINKVDEKISHFEDEESLKNIFGSVKWCIDHNLIQQGITQLQEGIITALCKKFGYDFKKSKDREFFSGIFNVIDKPEDKWKNEVGKRRDEARKILNKNIIKKLSKPYDRLSKSRNDINHSGFRDNSIKDGSKFKDKLEKDYKEITNILKEEGII